MRFIAFTAALLICSICQGQNQLSKSLQRSELTKVYKITTQQAQSLFGSDMKLFNDSYLHTYITSFTTGTKVPVLPQGNYVLVAANENRLVTSLFTTGNIFYNVLINNRDFIVALCDKNGVGIKDAQVWANHRSIPYDSEFNAYHIKGYNKSGMVKIKNGNTLFVFPIETSKKYNRYGEYYGSNIFKKLLFRFPLKYIATPIRKKINKVRYSRNSFFYSSTKHEKKFKSFFVLNKPMYKPGDTVKLKAFVQKKNGKPVSRELLLRLSNSSFDIDTILTTIIPYRKGGYKYNFVLNDSLDLDLDEDYMLTLEERKSKAINLATYKGDLNDDEYAFKRGVLARQGFNYEEYELKTIQFSARLTEKEHTAGMSNALFLKAVDENDMCVFDGRCRIFIVSKQNWGIDFLESPVFLPDTLWTFETVLDPIGETKVIIPDSIFPRASFDYEVVCDFLNSSNERQTRSVMSHYNGNKKDIFFEAGSDSLRIAYKEQGKSLPAQGTLTVLSVNDDTIEHKTILLPCSMAYNPVASYYIINIEKLSGIYKANVNDVSISCNSMRTRDSVFLQIENPAHLPIWYTILNGNKIIHRGHGETIRYKEKSVSPKNYFVSIQYIYGGKPFYRNYTIPYRDKLLNISVTQPSSIFPGQSSKIDIEVHNNKGEPVKDADITAYSFTKKFRSYSIPNVPYLGKIYKNRKGYTTSRQDNDIHTYHKENKLNWERWAKELQIDNNEYYKFLHPQGIYVNTEPANDSITQIAPFVVLIGDIQPIHMLYIDERPVFFSQATQLQRYSFRVSAGVHRIKLRTHDRLVTIDTIVAIKGCKTFFCIDIGKQTSGVTVETFIKDGKPLLELSDKEMALWNAYMILVNNIYNENYAYINNADNNYLINRLGYNGKPVLVGPLYPNKNTEMRVKNSFSQQFDPEGGYIFNITSGLIKQKQTTQSLIRKQLSPMLPKYNFSDFVLTEKEIDSLWISYLDMRTAENDLYFPELKLGKAELRIDVENDKNVIVKNILLFRKDDADYLKVYSEGKRSLGYLLPDEYRLLFLLKDNNYVLCNNIIVKENGLNYYRIILDSIKVADSMSRNIFNILSRRFINPSFNKEIDLNNINQSLNQQYLEKNTFKNTVYGKVHDNKKRPIVGATVVIKNTGIGTSTGIDGQFTLRVPVRGKLLINAVGYSQQEKAIEDNGYLDITLFESDNRLEEVVVVGYGLAHKKDLTASVATVTGELQGRVAGLSMGAIPGSETKITIRGVNTMSFQGEPLIIMDGIPVSKAVIETLSKEDVESINILKGSEAIAIYGTQANAGAVIIKSKKGSMAAKDAVNSLLMQANSLRTHFRDDAYWQPALRTDKNGKTSFYTTFPDDITSWLTYVVAIGNKRFSGIHKSEIRAFKNVSANLSLPQFLIDGDTLQAIGKVLNYGMDSIKLNRGVYKNKLSIKNSEITLKNSYIDTIGLFAVGDDSLKIKYTIEQANGFFDGEERTIPVYRQGVKEAMGLFASLKGDTTLILTPNIDTGLISIHAEASLLPILVDETKKIRQYEYLCNEQLASKLKALLAEKKIYGLLNKKFTGEKDIMTILTLLESNKNKNGLWGWWQGTSPLMWISRHAIEALLLAQENGYTIALNKPALIDFLTFNIDTYRNAELLATLKLLQRLGANFNYKKYVDTLEKYAEFFSMYEKLGLLELRQKLGEDIQLQSWIDMRKYTVFGNIYWGDDNSIRFFDNSIQNTLCMYRLIRSKNMQDEMLTRIQNYFLEKRKDGNWRNTYESSLILETILPDVLTSKESYTPPVLTINSSNPVTVSQFPYTATWPAAHKIFITKKGSAPVYFTAYQQYWNAQPAEHKNNFVVSTTFLQENKEVAYVHAGIPVTLNVHVEVLADAEYVMVEIPIPAGCTYETKYQSWANNEVHREHFKNKVSLFCTLLKAGSYNFSVALMPRFAGVYHLNPAKAEMMYFPTFYGREKSKQVLIN